MRYLAILALLLSMLGCTVEAPVGSEETGRVLWKAYVAQTNLYIIEVERGLCIAVASRVAGGTGGTSVSQISCPKGE